MNTYDLIPLDQEFLENTASRVPLCLCLDVSASMAQVVEGEYQKTGEQVYKDGQTWDILTGGISRLDKLLEGLEEFKKSTLNDIVAKKSIEVCIVTFSDSAECILDFCTADKFTIPEINLADETNIGAGISLALDKLEARKNLYKESGIDYYQPILVIMSDGANTDNTGSLERASRRVQSLVNDRKLSCFQIGIDDNCNLDELTRINPKRGAKLLKSQNFKEFFDWLSKSTSALSRSTIGEKIPLPPSDGWESF